MPELTEPRSGLKYGWTSGEDDWGAAMNNNLLSLGRYAYHPAVISISTATPPASPANGDGYIVPASPTGAWVGQENKLAVWDSGAAAWVFATPWKGWIVYVDDIDAFRAFKTAGWGAM